MRRRLLVIGLGITVLLGGSLVLLVLLTPEAPPVPEPPREVTAAPQAVPSTPPAVAPLAPPPWAAAARPRSAAQESRPQVRDPSAPGKADRTTRKAVRKALLSAPLEEELARCVERDREVWFGGGSASSETIPRAKPAILMLELEASDRQVKIVGARVKSWGGVSRTAVACARDALVGKVVAVARSKPARLMQMTFLLSPRSGAVATAR
jgi:pyruvate/2-oxoglutarate dehydrogenase complex dihydrolipoamide acyltransferase (E2) component